VPERLVEFGGLTACRSSSSLLLRSPFIMSQSGSSSRFALHTRYTLMRDNLLRLGDTLQGINNKEDARHWASEFMRARVGVLLCYDALANLS
jgi:hypothetical protein